MTFSCPMIRRHLVAAIAAVASGVLVALPFNYASLYPLTWFAFVPLLLAVHGRGAWGHYGLGLVAGLGTYLAISPWMISFLQRLKDYSFGEALAGAILFWLVSSQLPALMMLALHWLRKRLYDHVLWAFPVVAMLFYGWFPIIFPLQLGESQSAFLPAIQGISLTGVYGLDLMIGISNALITAGILRWFGRAPGLNGRPALAVASAGALTLAFWLGLGWWSLAHWDQRVADWPTLPVGIVQSNETPSASVPDPEPGHARAWPPEMDISQRLADAGAAVVVWPETRYKGYFEVDHLPAAYRRNVSAMGVPVILHDAEQQGSGEDFREYNSALFLGAEGELVDRYRKHQLVAFAETLPLSRRFPWLVSWVEQYLGDFFANLTPGSERVSFPVQGVQLVPAICYESAFPAHVARSVASVGDSPMLVVLSNNGWFGNSREPYQHVGATTLRAVENRVSLVHVVNNGPSTVVTPTGRILASTPFGERGGMVSNVPYTPPGDGFRSWFTRFPEWFAVGAAVVLVLSLILYGRGSRG